MVEPVDPTVVDRDHVSLYGKRETYVHAFGKLPFVALTIRDQEYAHLFYRRNAMPNVVASLEQCGVVGAKVIYKRPGMYAAAGQEYMVKVYFGNDKPPALYQLRQLLRDDSALAIQFTGDLHHSSISSYSDWFTARHALINGEFKLQLNACNTRQRSGNSREYNVVNAYYKDIVFNTGHLFVYDRDETRRRFESLVCGEKMRAVFDSLSPVARAMVDVEWTALRVWAESAASFGRATYEWTYLMLKTRVVYALTPNILGRQRRGTPRSMSCLLGNDEFKSLHMIARMSILFMDDGNDDDDDDDDDDEQYHNKERELLDKMTKVRGELCRLDYTVRYLVKQYWKREVLDVEMTRERVAGRLTMLRRITQANRWISFDIEVDYVPHERKDERITMIGVTLFDHAHSVPLEHRLFARIADRRIAHDDGKALPARGDTWRSGIDADCRDVREMDLGPVAELCRKTAGAARDFKEINMVPGVSFEVVHSTSEYTMLQQFVKYIRDARVSGICYFNGHKFDMPFVYARLSVLSAAAGDGQFGDPAWVRSSAVKTRRTSVSSMATTTATDGTSGGATAEPTQRRNMLLTLTHLQDQIQIRYKFKRPSPDHRKSGISLRAQSINAQRDAMGGGRGANDNGDGDDSDGDGDGGDYCEGNADAMLGDAVTGHDGAEFIPISVCETTAPNEKPGGDDASVVGGPMFDASAVSDVTASVATAHVNPMLAARKITTLSMMNVGLLDVMLEVGDRNRGCRLDVASERLLGINKVHDERVTYANLTRTFTHGNVADLQVAYGYCMMDVIITMMLLKVKKIELSYMADTTISGSQPRELYTSEMVKSTVNTGCQYGYWANILTPDVTHSRDERHMWVPGYEFNAERDMPNLRPLGGRTVQSNGIYVQHVISCLDFVSQYPSIMRSHNIGLSSLLRKQGIVRNKLVKDIDYTMIWVENVRPCAVHACKHDCDTGLNGRGDPSKCVSTVTFHRTGTEVYFATKALLEAIVAQSSTDLAEQRLYYKRLRDEAIAGGTVDDAELYEVLQIAVKLRMNGAYGVMMKCSALVGGAVTQIGRHQNEAVSRKGKREGFLVVNGDTDSVMLMDTSVDRVGSYAQRGQLSRYSITYAQKRRAPTRDIFQAINSRWKRFCAESNNGRLVGVDGDISGEMAHAPLYGAQCELEPEKTLIWQRIDETKQ